MITGAGPGRAGGGARRRSPRRGRRSGARALLVAAFALLSLAALAGTASAGTPVFQSSVTCSLATPCGSFTSWSPGRLAVDEASGDVYVIDNANDAIQVFASDGTYVRSILGSSISPGAGTFSFGGDDDIAVDNSGGANAGNVYVNSEHGGLVFAFDRTGAFLWQAGGFGDVCGIGVDPSGRLWGADFSGGILPLSAADGSVTGPAVIVTGDTCHFAFDGLSDFILNHWNANIEKYDSSGNSLLTYVPGFTFVDVAADESSNVVYAALPGSGIYFWDSAGNLQGGSPFAPNATAVTVDAVGHRLFASTSTGVEIYSIPVPHTVRVVVDGTGSGRVDADHGAISGCTSSGGTCSDLYNQADSVQLQASADSGSQLTGLTVTSGTATPTTCTSPTPTNPCSVTVNTDDITITATFDTIPNRTLRVDFAGSGAGHVTSAPSGIDCTATCSHDFPQGELIALTATPAAHSTFVGWSGGGCSGTDPCQLTLDTNTDVTATFAQDLPSVAGAGASGITTTGATLGGTVNPNGAATTCEFEYGTTTSYGTRVPCSANPGSGASAVAVSAALSGLASGTTYHFRLDATNAGGTANGDDATFTTGTVTTPPPGGGTPPPTETETYGQCVKSANMAYKKALKAAKRKHGKARARAIHAAQKKKGKLVSACKKRFG